MKPSILVFEAHPDDVEIGMGGTLGLLKDVSNITLLTFSDGSKSPLTNSRNENIRIRKMESRKAASMTNAERVYFDFEDANLINSKDKVQYIVEKYIDKHSPELIFTHWYDDTHTDHKTIGDVFRSINPSNAIYWEEYSTLIFKPNIYVNITGKMHFKRRLLECYQSQWYTIRYAEVLKLDKMRGDDIKSAGAEAFFSSHKQVREKFMNLLGEKVILK